jgi:hypothetical protein
MFNNRSLFSGPVGRREGERFFAGRVADKQRFYLVWTPAKAAFPSGQRIMAKPMARESAALENDRNEVLEGVKARRQVADDLQAQGALDEALRIRREELLPAFEKLGDGRSRAVTLGQMADILTRKGDLDGALRIRREEQLPLLDQLGAAHERAVAMGKIADILTDMAELNEAVRIRREEQLPVFEKLGDERSLLTARVNMALAMLLRGRKTDQIEARKHLCRSLKDAQRLKLPELEKIKSILKKARMSCR